MSRRTALGVPHAALLGALVLALALWLVPSAQAAQNIVSFNTVSTDTEAGAHPNLTASIVLEDPGSPEAAESLSFNLPSGVFGNPNAITPCIPAFFALMECTPASQAGYMTIRASYSGNPNFLLGTAPVYVVSPRGDKEPARLGFYVPILNIAINIPIHIRTAGDYGLRMTVAGIPQSVPVAAADLTIWGVPALTANDTYRFRKGSPGDPAGCPGESTPNCASENGAAPNPAGILPKPLINNPSICSGQQLVSVAEVRTYQDPETVTTEDATYPATTSCETQSFKPVLNMALTSEETDSPSGMDMQLKAASFLGLASTPSPIRHATVQLPAGLSVNPDAADGQTACTDDQANFDTEAPAECPDTSKIGVFEIGTPALDEPLEGALYIGEPKPGNQYRLIMVASGYAIHAKVVAKVLPDPVTGQVRFEVTDLPQVPFETFDVHLFASDRGLLATPTHCTIYNVESSFSPWNDRLSPQPSRPLFSLTAGPDGKDCPNQVRPYKPRLVAGMSNPTAGAYSNFHLKLDRDDGDQYLSDLGFKMPPGFTGYLRGITYCPDSSIAAAAEKLGRAEQVSPSCPASSRVGSTNVAAGPGSHPFNAVGKMYLAGGVKGSPLSVVAITPALAGPYDYGTVVVRVPLRIDPLTAQVSATSDRVPLIIGGIPIRMRSIQVSIDRPGFTINPTNCSNFTVDSLGIGDQGTIANFSSPFHAVNCASLPFRPRVRMRQVGGNTERSSNPKLQFDLRTKPGDANLSSLSVTLPKAFEIDQRHLGNICSERELIENQCAGRTAIGRATTTTPLLDEPLSGPVYAVSGSGGLPRLAFILNGQVSLVPRADTKTVDGRLQTTAPVIPDAPIGHFALTVFGGKRGYLINTRNLCGKPPTARIGFVGQNGKTRSETVAVKTSCSKAAKRRARR